jgi:hypothetical protein
VETKSGSGSLGGEHMIIKSLLLISLSVLFAGCVLEPQAVTVSTTQINLTEKPIVIPTLPIPTPTPTPIFDFNPQRDFAEPSLWDYTPFKDADIWYAVNYQDYITPNDPIVAYFDNAIKFKNFKQHYTLDGVVTDTDAIVFLFKNDSQIPFTYKRDMVQVPPYSDYWVSPAYYIWHGFNDDCEEYAYTWASVLDRRNIPYMFVNGFQFGRIADAWVEFQYDGKIYLMQVGQAPGSAERIVPADDLNLRQKFIPYMMFNRTTPIQRYKVWWS